MNKNVSTLLLTAAICALPNALIADTIDDFSGGGTHLINNRGFDRSGHSLYQYIEDASILGGARELKIRDAWSGVFGGWTGVLIDDVAGTATLYGTNRNACDLNLAYGTTIGVYGEPWSPNPNVGLGTELNLALTPNDEVLVNIDKMASYPDGTESAHVFIEVRNSTGYPYRYAAHFLLPGANAPTWCTPTSCPQLNSNEAAIPLSAFVDPWGVPLNRADRHPTDIEVDGIRFATGGCGWGGVATGVSFSSFGIGSSDSDEDGVGDSDDLCPDTAAGSLVDATGCSGAQLVEIECPATGTYKNHGKYVSCVSNASEDALDAGLLTEEEKDAIVSAAAKSSVGKKK